MIILDIVLSITYYILQMYAFCLVIAGILSLVGANPYNPFVTFFRAITSPPCRYLVKKFPKLVMRTEGGFIDLSPVVLILIIGCLMIIDRKIALYLGIYI